MPKNWCFWIVLEKTLESPLDFKEMKSVNHKEINPEYSLEVLILNLCSSTLATWCQEPTHWKRPWCWERVRARGEGGGRGWDGWMTSLTRWTWVGACSGRQWRTEEPGVLQSLGLQSQTHPSDWTTNLYFKDKKMMKYNAIIWNFVKFLLVEDEDPL